MRIDSDVVDLGTAGTVTKLLNTNDRIVWIKIKALAANSGLVYVGTSDVSASNGYELHAGGGADGQVELDFGSYRDGSVKASDLCAVGAADNEDVTWIAILI